jgi:hypothetical protein
VNRLFGLVLLVLATAGTSTDTLPVSGPAGTYTVKTSGPTRISSGPTWVRLDWDAGGQVVTPPVPIAPALHTGHFTLSYIEPKYPMPASAQVRDQLAGENWTAIDATYRSYTDGQSQLTSLGFTRCYAAADLPIAFLQEDQAAGSPIIDKMKSPASADAVVAWVKGFRGQ